MDNLVKIPWESTAFPNARRTKPAGSGVVNYAKTGTYQPPFLKGRHSTHRDNRRKATADENSSIDRCAVAEFDAFALQWMVTNKRLTDYQVSLLAKGQSDGFFVGAFEILDRIGKGRMAGVYKAKSNRGEIVAIKVLPPSRAKDPETLARFQREARLAVQLDHPCLVKTRQFGEADGLHYLVMEHLEGEILETLLKERGKLTPAEAVRIGFLTCLGMQHIHEKGLVHRDLNPSNLMLCPAPSAAENTLHCKIKILDIGLGRKLFNPDSDATSEGLTNEEHVLGSPDYLAPEQARDARRVDIRGDIYSLGCTIYHMLVGKPPFSDQNFVRQVMRHANESPRPLVEINPKIPVALDQIVLKMLAKEPRDRFHTPVAAAQALQQLLGKGRGSATR